MRYEASFKDFLNAGRLGPIHTGLKPSQVAATLGMPGSWMISDETTFPAYWCYGCLEISFYSRSSPFDMEFFQIEHAETLAGRFALFGNAGPMIRMRLDGLGGRSRPSAFLRAMAGGAAETWISHDISEWGSFNLWIVKGDVSLIFNGDIDEKLAARARQMPPGQLFRLLDRSARIDSIYAHAPSVPQAPSADGNVVRITAQAFLEGLSARSGRPSSAVPIRPLA